MKNHILSKIICLSIIAIFLLVNNPISVHAQATKAAQKKKKKTPEQSSFVSNQFQDLTTRYNRYFNAKLRYQEGIEKLTSEGQDNYDEMLSIYEFSGGDGTNISDNLNDVIEKTSIAIQLKPNSKWVDDCYLLLGQAYYLKGDYDAAIQSFQYVTNKFDKSIRKTYDRRSKDKSKKLKEKSKADERREKEKEKKEALKAREDEKKDKEDARKESKKFKEKQRKEAEKAKEEAKKAAEEAKEEERKALEKAKEDERKAREEERKIREDQRKADQKAREEERKAKEKEKQQRIKEREKNKKKGKKKSTWTRVEDKEKLEALAAEKAAEEAEKKAEREAVLAEREAERQARAAEREKEKAEKIAAIEAQKAERLAEADRKKAEREAAAEEKRLAQEAKEEAEKKQLEEDKRVEEEAAAIEASSLIEENDGAEPDPTFKSGNFLAHQPAKHEAMLWLIRSFVEQKQFGEAETVIRLAKSDNTFPKKLAGEIQALEAHYLLQSEDFDKAKPLIAKAAPNTKKKNGRARRYYILAQIEEKQQNYAEAATNFEKVIKARPSFDMELNAHLKIAQNRKSSGQYSSQQAIAYLEKMTKDGKNIDHLDKIYFAMAEIALADGDMDKANEFLKKSAGSSTLDPAQKAMAFLRLAKINYDAERYNEASTYYDSTLTTLPKKHEKYPEVLERQAILSELVQHLNIVALEDSLQRIAQMPKAVRQEFIENLITQLEDEAEAKRAEERQEFLDELDRLNKDKKASKAFYFYNPAEKARGLRDFENRWGDDRPLTDNWRLRSKLNNNNVLAQGDSSAIAPNRDELREMAERGKLSQQAILAKLPLTKDQMAQSDSLIIKGLYAMGTIYRERLDNKPKAIEAFNRLLKQYPDNTYEPQTHYQLYLLGEQPNVHKKQIMDKYPDSIFAKLLEDPEYLKNLDIQKAGITNYYEETYNLFLKENYEEALKRVQTVDQNFKENPLKAKFALLESLIIGKTADKAAYIAALENVVKTFKNTEEAQKASEMLGFLNADADKKGDKKGTKAISAFQVNANQNHFLVIILDNFSNKVSNLNNNLSDFNKANFSVEKIKVKQMRLRSEPKPLILIKSFANAEKGMLYYKTLKTKENDIFRGLGVGYKMFVISKSNFTKMFKDESVEEYEAFFKANYR